MKLLKSKRIWIPLAVVITLLMVPVVATLIAEMKDNRLASQWENESSVKLADATTYQATSEMISDLGVMLGDPDGSWVAVDYRDTHQFRVVSVSVARTNSGEFFVSREHFCGELSGYQHAKNETTKIKGMIQDATKPEDIQLYQDLLVWAEATMNSQPLFQAIDSESDPIQQRELLIKLGFKPID